MLAFVNVVEARMRRSPDDEPGDRPGDVSTAGGCPSPRGSVEADASPHQGEPMSEATKPAEKAPDAPKAEGTPAPVDPAEFAKVKEALAKANAEAKAYREQASTEAKAKADAAAKAADLEKAAAEKAGEWSKVVEIEKAAAAKLQAELAAATAKAALADKYEATIKSEVDALAAKLGADAAQAVAGLPVENQLATLRFLSARAAGPGAATAPPSGNPPAPTVPLENMAPEARKAYLASLPTEKRRALMREASGEAYRPPPFARGGSPG